MTSQLQYSAAFAVRMSAALVCSIVVLAVMLCPTGAHAQYRLSIGDKVQIHVFGQEGLDQSATVDGDGKIWVPTLGHVQAAGRTLRELRENLSSVLTVNANIRAEDINVNVIEFRPFYVDGTVTNPGSYPYSVGLTVRQAIAIAGGIARGETDQKFSNLVDQRASYQSLWSQYLQRHARVARLQAELQGKNQFDWTPPRNLLASAELAHRVRDLEETQFKARAKTIEHQKTHLDAALMISTDEISELEQQRQRVENEYKLVSQRLSGLESLQEKGLLRAPRVSAYELTVFLVRSRYDSTAVQLVRAKRSRHDLLSERKQIDIARREEVTRELQSTVFEMDSLHSQMIVAASGLLNSNAVMERKCAPQTKEGIRIHRQKNSQNKRFSVSEDSDVQPGDVVEVNIIDEVLRAQCLSQNLGAQQMLAGEKPTQ